MAHVKDFLSQKLGDGLQFKVFFSLHYGLRVGSIFKTSFQVVIFVRSLSSTYLAPILHQPSIYLAYPASILPLFCPYLASILPLLLPPSCLYSASVLPLSCPHLASILPLSCISCPHLAPIYLAPFLFSHRTPQLQLVTETLSVDLLEEWDLS